MAFLLVTGSCVVLCVTFQHSFSQWDPSVGAAVVKSGNFWSQLSRSPPSLCPLPTYLPTCLPAVSANIYHDKGIFAFSSQTMFSSVESADTSWITFHRKLYHPEFPCNPEEKLPICPFRAITPLRLYCVFCMHITSG